MVVTNPKVAISDELNLPLMLYLVLSQWAGCQSSYSEHLLGGTLEMQQQIYCCPYICCREHSPRGKSLPQKLVQLENWNKIKSIIICIVAIEKIKFVDDGILPREADYKIAACSFWLRKNLKMMTLRRETGERGREREGVIKILQVKKPLVL